MNRSSISKYPVNQEPPKVGALIEGTIERLGSLGVGIMRHNGFVIFSPFTIDNEKVVVEVEKVYKNYALARLVHIIEPSLDRVKPKCRVFGVCGGCHLQHMSYEKQLKLKEEVVNEAIKNIGKIDSPFIPIKASSIQWGYRRHITLKRVGTKVGFVGIDNKTIVEIDNCPIFDEKKFELKPNQTKLFKSDSHIHDILGFTIFSSPNAFLQNHAEQSLAIYQDIVTSILAINPKQVLDLYCGIGITTLILAKNSIKCVGIELNKEAIELAKKNALHNGINNVQFIASSVEKVINAQDKYDVVLVNPPRTGLDKTVIEGIKKIDPEHLFYISCMPQTLARDVHLLGYEIVSGKAYDMFPQTFHVETALHLRKKQ